MWILYLNRRYQFADGRLEAYPSGPKTSDQGQRAPAIPPFGLVCAPLLVPFRRALESRDLRLSASRLRVIPANGFTKKLRGVGELQLFLDASAIGLNCFYAHIQRLRHAPCFVTLSQKPKHLEFAIAELFDRRMQALQVFLAKPLREDALHSRAYVQPAGKEIAYGGGNTAGGFSFHDVTAGAGAKGALRIIAFVVHRQDDNRNLGHFGCDPLDESEP